MSRVIGFWAVTTSSISGAWNGGAYHFDEPVAIVIIYASLGALFMPFLAMTLLWLLNRRVPRDYRSGWPSNLVLSVLIFFNVSGQEIIGALGG